MVTPFTLTYTNDATGSTVTYTSDNITNINVDFNTPIAPMPLPQMEDKENILIKVEGNTTTANISWKIRDRDATPFSGGAPYNAADTAMEQILIFKDHFVPVDVSDSYVLTIGDTIVLKGTLMKMSFAISGTSPVVWDGSFQFVHGNVASSQDALLADAPIKTNNSAILTGQDNTSSGHKADIPQIKTTYFGVDEGITGYTVKYKLSSADSWTLATTSNIAYSQSQTDATNQTLTVDVGSAGTYDFRVAATSTTNPNGNKWSNVIENVVVA